MSLDQFYEMLIPALWIAWGIYWLVSSYRVKVTAREESPASRASSLVPLITAAALLSWSDSSRNLLFHSIWPRTPLTFWVGVAFVVAGLGFTVWARVVLGPNWSGTVTIKTGHEFIQTGPYRWVRHPIYTGLLAAFIGSAIAMAEWRGILAVLLVLLAFVVRIRLEERWMTEVFGPNYEAYRKRVSELIPFVW